MVYYTDGYILPSYGGGFTVFLQGKLIKSARVEKKGLTNNEAELLGIVYAAMDAKDNDTIITDSLCCIYWIRRGKAKARPDLNVFCSLVRSLKEKKALDIHWESRETNLAGIYNEKNHSSFMSSAPIS